MFERFPEFKIVSAENDIAWVPHLLERADKYYRRFKQGYGTLLSLKPSEYFRRQVFATFIDDPLGLKVYSYLGADNFILVNRLSASGCDLAAHNGSAGARFCSASGGRPAKDARELRAGLWLLAPWLSAPPSELERAPAAVDRHHAAGHEARLVAGQEHRQCDDLCVVNC